MKKIITIGLMCLVMVGCSKNKLLIEINYEDFKEKIENKESFILYIGSTNCSYCARYNKTLKRVMDKYQVTVYYINVGDEKMTQEENKQLDNETGYSGATPTTVFVKKGEVQGQYNRIRGYVESDKIIKAFIKNGYIEEK